MIIDEIFTGLFLGILYGGMSSLVVMLISIAFRYFTGERFSSIMGIILGLGIVGISGGLLAILDQPTIGGIVQITAASMIIALGVKYGDRMAVKMPKQGISLYKMFSRAKRKGRIIVKMPKENLIRNIAGKPRVMDRLKKELSGKEFVFPFDLPIEELVKRVRRQLMTDWGLGDVEVELNEEGEVTYLAVADREQTISETIDFGYVALPLEYDVAPSGVAPRDIVRVRLEDDTYIHRAEVKGIDREKRAITIIVEEGLLEKYEGKRAKQIIALPTYRPAPLVKDIMTTSVKTITADEDVQSAVKLMNKFKIGNVVVVERERPIGIVTDSDVLERVIVTGFNPNLIKIKDIMSMPLITIELSGTIEEAIELMESKKVKKLLVMDDEELVGIVTTKDFLRIGRIVL
ncbi:MAG: CBS domain-containing protein [Candidatus Methylarchaceae archaeon HK02M1]|nr:CBS domain-containing protein [Candidatus Methylarchaceae archaeon HK02M1]